MNMNSNLIAEESSKHPALRPVHQTLFPVLDNLESVVDLAISQLPIVNPTQVVGLLMTYHNTMVKIMEDSKNETIA